MKRFVVNRPWGNFEQFTLNEKTTIKILTVNPKKRLSLQYHKKRKEFWKVLDNPVRVVVGKKTKVLKKGEVIEVPKGVKHRIIGLNKEARLLEIAFGDFDENDNYRVEDDYGRLGKAKELKGK